MIVERPGLERRVLESLDAGRIPVVLGGCASGRTSLLLRLHALFGHDRAQYIDVAAAATTPERCAASVLAGAPKALAGGVPPGGFQSARDAFDALTAFFASVTAAEGAPVTFLLDEAQDVRTFESFPGLRHVQRELISRLADSPNAFVLASRFQTRAHRLLRDAPARFEVIHAPVLTADEAGLIVRQRTGDGQWAPDLIAGITALSGGRAGYASLLVEALLRQPAHRRSAPLALATALAPDGALTARCRESYEFRLHRARGYGALKAILGVLGADEGLTLTEISQRLHRTPGSTKDYLSWLEDVDLVTVQRKRYAFADPLLRVFVRLHAQPAPPTPDDIAREVADFAQRVGDTVASTPTVRDEARPQAVASPQAVAAGDRSGIIEID